MIYTLLSVGLEFTVHQLINVIRSDGRNNPYIPANS